MTWLCAVGKYIATGCVERRPMVTVSPKGTTLMHVAVTFIEDLPSMRGPVFPALNSTYYLNLIIALCAENTGSWGGHNLLKVVGS